MDNSRGHDLIVSTAVLVSIAGATVGVRFATKLRYAGNVGPEDWTILLSLASAVAMTVFMCREGLYGTGRHFKDLTEHEIIENGKALYGSIIAYFLSLSLTKVSFLLQYIRIFPGKRMRLAIWISFGLVGVYGLWTVFSSIFFCSPIRFFWDKSISGGKCLHPLRAWVAAASAGIATDLIIIGLPLPGLKRLMLPMAQKIALILVFALGGFICLVSVLRVPWLVIFAESTDPTWDNQPIAKWTAIEANVAIMCACLPALRPLLARFYAKYVPSSGSRGDRSFSKIPQNPRSASLMPHSSEIDEVPLKSFVTEVSAARDPSEASYSDPRGAKVTTVVEVKREKVPETHACA